MDKVALILAGLACLSQGRRVQMSSEAARSSFDPDVRQLEKLAAFFLALNPVVTQKASRAGLHIPLGTPTSAGLSTVFLDRQRHGEVLCTAEEEEEKEEAAGEGEAQTEEAEEEPQLSPAEESKLKAAAKAKAEKEAAEKARAEALAKIPFIEFKINVPPRGKCKIKMIPMLRNSEAVVVQYPIRDNKAIQLDIRPQGRRVVVAKDGPGGERIGDILRYTTQWKVQQAALNTDAPTGAITSIAGGGIKWTMSILDVTKAKKYSEVTEALTSNKPVRTDTITLVFERPIGTMEFVDWTKDTTEAEAAKPTLGPARPTEPAKPAEPAKPTLGPVRPSK